LIEDPYLCEEYLGILSMLRFVWGPCLLNAQSTGYLCSTKG